MVSLKDGHAPTADYVRKLRQALPAAFPEDFFYFQPADIATQILNFGLTAQIDVRTVGYDRVRTICELPRTYAAASLRIPGVVDAHLQQEVDAPDFSSISTAPEPCNSASPQAISATISAPA